MYIKEITLKDFRNYKDLHTSFHPRVNIFLGKNAQGKTNLLEGIYLNAMARLLSSWKGYTSLFFHLKI